MGSRRRKVSCKNCWGCTKWIDGASCLQGPPWSWQHVFVLWGALQNCNKNPTPNSLLNLKSSERKLESNLPSSPAPLWPHVLNCVDPQDGQGPRELKERVFPPSQSVTAVAHSSERWACAPPNAGYPSKASTPKGGKGKSLIFHNKPRLISIAFSKNTRNVNPMNGHLISEWSNATSCEMYFSPGAEVLCRLGLGKPQAVNLGLANLPGFFRWPDAKVVGFLRLLD